MRFLTRIGFYVATLAALAMSGGFIAAAQADQPSPWAMGLQEAATPIMEDIIVFDNFLLVIITVISLFVLALLLIIMIRFNARANPVPSKTSHNTLLEVAWTIVPILILVAIAVPSFRLLYKQIEIPEADLTVKATGYQWYWGYEYPDHGEFMFDSRMLPDEELNGRPRLLATDTEMVVPVGKTVRVVVTAADVIHSFAVPSFGVKVDAIPGRLNETWFRAEKTGLFYGQCSELCGINHAFMPIAIRVVSEEDFAVWVERAKEEYAGLNGTTKLALAASGN